ncbi:unnamed protein product [Cylindrotheca closterium]|uniref:Uncharacterized protein n=1 Tax=Cylindrotheca closterium TaxID=2856 RepID=A0AAD2FU00_9STRA|nr:unnamed protein product [Cylindrotheca closterium]
MIKDNMLCPTILLLALVSQVGSFTLLLPCLNTIHQQKHHQDKQCCSSIKLLVGDGGGTFENVQNREKTQASSSSSSFSTCSPSLLVSSRKSSRSSSTRRNAIIYGWDGEDSDETDTTSTAAASTAAASTVPSYFTVDSDIGPDACPPEGLAVAMKLSDDLGRMGSLARLAAAFSPPEQGLSIQDIEKVEVTCVREHQIELEAILCETYGCVTLSVPVQFPNECGDMDMECAIQNLDSLDIRAETMVSHMQASMEELSLDNADLEELVELNDKTSFPNWWVPPGDIDEMGKECESIKSLLNEAEFHSEIVALAQDGMEKNANINGNGWNNNQEIGSLTGKSAEYQVQRAKVAAVGPAGICIKVAAIQLSEPGRGTQYLDVAYPFSASSVSTIHDAATLRANVLGVVIAAADKGQH